MDIGVISEYARSEIFSFLGINFYINKSTTYPIAYTEYFDDVNVKLKNYLIEISENECIVGSEIVLGEILGSLYVDIIQTNNINTIPGFENAIMINEDNVYYSKVCLAGDAVLVYVPSLDEWVACHSRDGEEYSIKTDEAFDLDNLVTQEKINEYIEEANNSETEE